MSARAASIALFACTLVALRVHAGDTAAPTRTLLVPRTAAGALALVDPGSGLTLASVALDTGPRRVAASPHATLAAVLGCTPSDDHRATRVTLSIVDVEHPGERRRIDLGRRACPASLTWSDADHIEVAGESTAESLAVDPDSGAVARVPARKTLPGGAARTAIDPSMLAVQQFLADGGRVDDLAVTTTMPRAVCHACIAEPQPDPGP